MLDNNLIMSDAQALTATADSTTTLDLGALTDDRGTALTEFGPENGDIRLVVTLPTVTTSTGTSIVFALHDDSDDSGFTITSITKTLTGAAILAGGAGMEVLNIPLPPGVRRYIKMVYTVTDGGGSFSVGVNAHLAWGAQS